MNLISDMHDCRYPYTTNRDSQVVVEPTVLDTRLSRTAINMSLIANGSNEDYHNLI